MEPQKIYYVYILRTDKNTLYTGYTNNIEKRILAHKKHSKVGAKYLRSFINFELVFSEKFSSKSEAMKMESRIKKMSKIEKETFLKSSMPTTNYC